MHNRMRGVCLANQSLFTPTRMQIKLTSNSLWSRTGFSIVFMAFSQTSLFSIARFAPHGPSALSLSAPSGAGGVELGDRRQVSAAQISKVVRKAEPWARPTVATEDGGGSVGRSVDGVDVGDMGLCDCYVRWWLLGKAFARKSSEVGDM